MVIYWDIYIYIGTSWFFGIYIYIWLVVWNMAFIFSIYWECHHPSWLSYFSEGLKPPTSDDQRSKNNDDHPGMVHQCEHHHRPMISNDHDPSDFQTDPLGFKNHNNKQCLVDPGWFMLRLGNPFKRPFGKLTYQFYII